MSGPGADPIPSCWPVLGVCGFSGAGKTSLIEAVVPALVARGLAVAVLKHDVHGMRIDVSGKDTDRFFACGATVMGRDPAQVFLRRRIGTDTSLRGELERLLRDHDLVLVEGYKDKLLPARIWLESPRDRDLPAAAGPFELRLPGGPDRPARLTAFLDAWLPRQLACRPLCAGLLIGGRSRRMGRSKALLLHHDRSWADRVADALAAHAPRVVLLGAGSVPPRLEDLPRLPDAPDHEGPLAGLVAALRWDPRADWIVAACDMPQLTAGALAWLLAQREPGRWAVVPRRTGDGPLEPLAAWYDARMLPILEECDRASAAARHPKVHTPPVPIEWDAAWRSFNSPEDLMDLR